MWNVWFTLKNMLKNFFYKVVMGVLIDLCKLTQDLDTHVYDGLHLTAFKQFPSNPSMVICQMYNSYYVVFK